MNKFSRLSLGLGSALLPVIARAQTVDPSASLSPLDYTTRTASYASSFNPAAASVATGAATAGFAAIGIMMMVAWLVGLLIYILMIFMFVDVAHREFPNPSTKTMWVVLMLLPFINFFALLAYLFVGRKGGTRADHAAAMANRMPAPTSNPSDTPTV